jgi:dUTP pyrophosphatase
MTKKIIRVKTLDDKARIPTKSNHQDAGWDLYASEDSLIKPNHRTLIKTGVALEIEQGFVGLIWPRSGLAVKSGVDVFAGVIDAGYRGEIGVCLFNSSDTEVYIKQGDRIAQVLFQEVPEFTLQKSDNLESTSRGDGGFGSSGK